ncbi:hypothetical protein AVEN_60430-1 [Araneus ventricosus]|uniref:Cyclic nucleotide phosphodiesterase catalytic domain-containing protein n=1 Tax=Araneus ventricosus TaxID=182803 RepID=A0A4Y2U4Z3_ARAVE|nr:hypothetical protein AVEN_60430-1 [Araneus ventricosus]
MASKVDDIAVKLGESTISSLKDKVSVNYFPLKMNKDKKTEMYVKFAKVMVIAQGPYSDERAKTFETAKKVFKYTSSVISDEKFKEQYRTKCSPENAETFYDYFKDTARKALEEGNNLLIIDSTMSNIHQNRYYVALAYKMQYVLLIMPPVVMRSSNNSWPKGSLADSFRIEASTVIQPANMFQHLFCAWYLHDLDSHELRHVASLYIQDCMEGIPEFNNLMRRNCPSQDPDGEEVSLIDAVRHYYCLVDKRQDVAYCSVKVFGDAMRAMNEYFKKESVVNTYGKMSKLLIAGFVISPHMIAARVKLTHQQKDFWEMEDELDENFVERIDPKPLCPSKLLEESKGELPDIEVQLIASKSNQTLINTGQTVHEPLGSIPRFAKGRACHIVLGKTIGAPSYHVDYDVQFALNRENKAMKAKADLPLYNLERCVAKRIGKYWFIYLKEMLRVDAFFASCVKPFAYDDAIKC